MCKDVTLVIEQIVYNPSAVDEWFPTPVFDGELLRFYRTYNVNGGDGFLSLTTDTVVNNQYPYPLSHYTDAMPIFPFQWGTYKPHIYIPKVKKVTDIDFREEFVSVDNSHSAVSILRNATDLMDVDNMPDRAYCYMMTDGGDVLFGCAGGHSLVRGMSVQSERNANIATNDTVVLWDPPSRNKFYSRVITDTHNTDNMVPASFINEFEGYMCWYKPKGGIHVFYQKSGEGYVVYIHTNQSISKGGAVLPDFMNGMQVDTLVEKTDGITLHTSIVTDGKLFFTSDNSQIEYNYAVFVVK